ncbi:C-type mannose receptor 2-like isoform 2-T2 [Syngnathus typhle]
MEDKIVNSATQRMRQYGCCDPQRGNFYFFFALSKMWEALECSILMLGVFWTYASAQCAPGWRGDGTSCYKKVEVPNGWLGAWHHCVSEGGNLVSITSSAEEDFVKATMGMDTSFWLGLSNLKCDKVWCHFEGGSQKLTWSDGQTTTYRFWAPNQLESANVSSCAYVNQKSWQDSVRWKSGSCASSLPYMCKRPLDCPTCSHKFGPAVLKTSDCDEDNFLYGDHCYFVAPIDETQEDAEKFCAARGAHLPIIYSKQDARFLHDHFERQIPWLGLKKKGYNYEWSDGTALDYEDVIEWSYYAKRSGGRPPLVGQPGWTEKCG